MGILSSVLKKITAGAVTAALTFTSLNTVGSRFVSKEDSVYGNGITAEAASVSADVIRGDIIQDEVVNCFDLVPLRQYIAGNRELSDSQERAADFNGDGNVDENDLKELSHFLLTGEYNEIPDIVPPTSDIEYADSFTVSKVFSSDMVVQRDENLRVWGWSDQSQNGKKISAEFKGVYAEGVVEDGQWTITFDQTFEADTSMGNTMRIYTDKQEVRFDNVLVGDVYMVIGQSNVHYSVWVQRAVFGDDPNKGGAASIDENALIRINRNTITESEGYPRRGTTDVCEDVVHDRGWQRATLDNIYDFSAIGYYTAANLLDITDRSIPIGMIEIDGDGRPLGSFLPNSLAEELHTDSLEGDHYKTSGANSDEARFIYNHYMYPFEKLAIGGVIWYQGESDYEPSTASVYAEHLTALMNYMRSTHNVTNKDFPVFLMELPTIYPNKYGIDNWQFMDTGKVRAAIGQIPQLLSNSYVCASSDLWNDDTYWNNLHPDIKFEQSQRMARLIAAVKYGRITMESATGPIFDSITYGADGKSAEIKFRNVGSGLSTSENGFWIHGFVGFDSFDSDVTDLDALIVEPDTIRVTSFFDLPRYIAYNAVSENYYGREIDLCNGDRSIAAAFICDKQQYSTTPSTGNGLDITNRNDLVSICYSVWFDGILGGGTDPVLDYNNITEVLEGKRDWGGITSFHYWAKPAQGYYRSTDLNAAKNNLTLLGEANVDFIILDFTNAQDAYVWDGRGQDWAYGPIETLCTAIHQLRAEGKQTPYISMWFCGTRGEDNPHGNEDLMREIYSRYYSNDEYKDCFVYWDNKPFVMYSRPEDEFPCHDLFTVRYMWGLTGDHCWRFLNTDNRGTAYENNGVVEQLSVATAAQENYMSNFESAHPRNHGIFFYDQWQEAFNVRPKIVTLTWWNEWCAQRLDTPLGIHFTDNYNAEYSRDIEPMEGGHGDQYYQWMKQYISAYKSGEACPRLVEEGY